MITTAALARARERPKAHNRGALYAKSVADAAADDALVEFDGYVGNYGRSACVGDSAIRGTRTIGKIDEEVFGLSRPVWSQGPEQGISKSYLAHGDLRVECIADVAVGSKCDMAASPRHFRSSPQIRLSLTRLACQVSVMN